MENTNEWIGWKEDEDSDGDSLDGVELARLQRLAEQPELTNFELGMMWSARQIYPGGPK